MLRHGQDAASRRRSLAGQNLPLSGAVREMHAAAAAGARPAAGRRKGNPRAAQQLQQRFSLLRRDIQAVLLGSNLDTHDRLRPLTPGFSFCIIGKKCIHKVYYPAGMALSTDFFM